MVLSVYSVHSEVQHNIPLGNQVRVRTPSTRRDPVWMNEYYRPNYYPAMNDTEYGISRYADSNVVSIGRSSDVESTRCPRSCLVETRKGLQVDKGLVQQRLFFKEESIGANSYVRTNAGSRSSTNTCHYVQSNVDSSPPTTDSSLVTMYNDTGILLRKQYDKVSEKNINEEDTTGQYNNQLVLNNVVRSRDFQDSLNKEKNFCVNNRKQWKHLRYIHCRSLCMY